MEKRIIVLTCDYGDDYVLTDLFPWQIMEAIAVKNDLQSGDEDSAEINGVEFENVHSWSDFEIMQHYIYSKWMDAYFEWTSDLEKYNW